MSRYVLLIILNTPLIIIGILNTTVSYKIKKIGKRRIIFILVLWIGIFAGLLFAEPIYNYLFTNNLTQTEPLSLFDVIQITAIISILFIANQANLRASILEKQVRDLHQELSIRLSIEDSKSKKK